MPFRALHTDGGFVVYDALRRMHAIYFKSGTAIDMAGFSASLISLGYSINTEFCPVYVRPCTPLVQRFW
jgi:hypothetical protein